MKYKDLLGNVSWKFLHVMAKGYPKSPDDDLKRKMRKFIEILSEIYPCAKCAVHFRQMLKKYPPEVDSNEELQRYFCTLHNIVNKKLGKRTIICK